MGKNASNLQPNVFVRTKKDGLRCKVSNNNLTNPYY